MQHDLENSFLVGFLLGIAMAVLIISVFYYVF